MDKKLFYVPPFQGQVAAESVCGKLYNLDKVALNEAAPSQQSPTTPVTRRENKGNVSC